MAEAGNASSQSPSRPNSALRKLTDLASRLRPSVTGRTRHVDVAVSAEDAGTANVRLVHLTDEQRYKAMKIPENMWCYCQLFHCKPFCQIPKGKPKICELRKPQCLIVWFFILAAILGPSIWALVTQTNPCGFKGMYDCGNKQCIPHEEKCDGVLNCKDGLNEESGCTPKFKFAPAYAVAMLGRKGSIPLKAVLGDSGLTWTFSDATHGDQSLTVTYGTGTGNDIYGVRAGEENAHYDLQIWRVELASAANQYAVRIDSSGDSTDVKLIVADEWSCSHDVSGMTVMTGDDVTMTATVRYYGDTAPEIQWYAGNKRVRSSTTSVSADHYTTLTKEYTFAASRHDNGKEYAAYLFSGFPRENNRSPPANSARSCTTYLNVLYPARDVKINETSNKVIPPNSNIECMADGNPEPDLAWDCEGGRFVAYGAFFTVPTGAPGSMTCRCIASNVIDGATYRSSASIDFKTGGSSSLCYQLSVIVTSLACMLALLR